MLNYHLSERSGTIVDIRLTDEGLEYLVQDHDTGVDYWFAAADLQTLVEA